MPEFAVTIQTVRVGMHTLSLVAEDVDAARMLAQAECDAGAYHCPPDWCTDDVVSTPVRVKQLSAGAGHRG